MNSAQSHNIQVTQNKHLAIFIMKSVSEWMQEICAANAKWWQPDILDDDAKLASYADDDSFFALTVDNEPAAAMVLTPKALDDWSTIDGDKDVSALHLGWVTVTRPFHGQGLVANLTAFAEECARAHNIDRLRLDTNAREPKLCNTYSRCGFTLVAEVASKGRITALFEKRVM